MVGHGPGLPLEVVGTMIELADVAWNAVEHRREKKTIAGEEEKILHLKLENERLKEVLAENLAILQNLSQISTFSKDCPSDDPGLICSLKVECDALNIELDGFYDYVMRTSCRLGDDSIESISRSDLYARLEAAIDSSSFLTKLESFHQESNAIPRSYLPTECTDMKEIDLSVNVDGEPCWWIWVTKDMVPGNLEEVSGIDNENYVIISEENVIDGIAEFIAKCIHENPKSKVLTPEQLQKTVIRALGGIKDKSKLKRVWEAGKFIHTLSTLGLFLAGLYRGRAVLKVAAMGVGAASKLAVKAL